METKIEKEVRYLKIYAVASTLLIIVFFVSAFTLENKKKFGEIDVERINIVEKDGKLRMVISNQERQHPGMENFKVSDRKRDIAGMVFFNERGDEAGGLFVSNGKGDSQYLSMTFDKFRQDQTIGLQHLENDEGYFAGLKVWDRPDISFAEQAAKREAIRNTSNADEKRKLIKQLEDSGVFGNERVIIGRGRDKTAVIELADPQGRTRIEMSVDVTGTPKMNFLDENGNVIYSLPNDRKAVKKQ